MCYMCACWPNAGRVKVTSTGLHIHHHDMSAARRHTAGSVLPFLKAFLRDLSSVYSHLLSPSGAAATTDL